MRYFLFIDECGNSSVTKPDPHINMFVLCGILFSEVDYESFNRELKLLKAEFFGTDETIFHFVKMRRKEGKFSIFKNDSLRERFISRLHSIIDESNFKIIASVVDKDRYRQRINYEGDAYHLCLKFMTERCAYCLRAEHAVSRVFLFAERRRNQFDMNLKLFYQKLKSGGTDFMSGKELNALPNEIQFRDKAANINGLQLADICAYPIARKNCASPTHHPIYDIIIRKFYKSKKGIHIGYGLKIFPESE